MENVNQRQHSSYTERHRWTPTGPRCLQKEELSQEHSDALGLGRRKRSVPRCWLGWTYQTCTLGWAAQRRPRATHEHGAAALFFRLGDEARFVRGRPPLMASTVGLNRLRGVSE